MSDLGALRDEIDAIDRQILELFEKRTAVSREIGNVKREHGLEVFDEAREEAKLAQVYAQAGYESRPYVRELYRTVMDLAKQHQDKPAFGVLGQTLRHTYSPEIHNMLDSSYTYSVIEKEPEELDSLFTGSVYRGFNVTIPYKRDAAMRCDVLDGDARATGSVNTVVFGTDGKTYGYNTDCSGFAYMLHRTDTDVHGKSVLVLGKGGAAASICHALRTNGASRIFQCSRSTEINYENVYDKCASAQIIVNCTPVGMYPDSGSSAINPAGFKELEACLDIVYNPSRTRLTAEASALGIKTCTGLTMLVAQAYKASELFAAASAGKSLICRDEAPEYGDIFTDRDCAIIEEVTGVLSNRMRNITLIGMPGCGKSILAASIAEATGRRLVDLDVEYFERYGQNASDTISEAGEECFRERESAVAAEVLSGSGMVISCGGGVVCRDVNKFFVRCNSNVFYLERPIDCLTDKNRPLSIANGAAKLYDMRRDKYESWCDFKVTYDKFDDKQEFLDKATADILNLLK